GHTMSKRDWSSVVCSSDLKYQILLEVYLCAISSKKERYYGNLLLLLKTKQILPIILNGSKQNINYHLITIVNFGIGLLLILLNFGSHFGNTFIYSIQNPIVLYFLIIKCQEQNGLQVLNSILLNIFFET